MNKKQNKNPPAMHGAIRIEGCTFYSGSTGDNKAVEALAAAAKANAEAISAIAKMMSGPEGGSVGLQFVTGSTP